MHRYIKIEAGCCGDCPYYNWKKHKCGKGATKEITPQDHFYSDCPLEWEWKEEQKDGVSEKDS